MKIVPSLEIGLTRGAPEEEQMLPFTRTLSSRCFSACETQKDFDTALTLLGSTFLAQRIEAFLSVETDGVDISDKRAVVDVNKRKGMVRSKTHSIEFERIENPQQFRCMFGDVPDCPVAVFDIMKRRSANGKLA